ncbi:MAG TPA: NAD(P)-binding domain-containing protein, partial [Paraburkholderia sp.]|nr:NAD(P)-binding domain-containing protein [Paraburkholderia sp.]
MQKQELGFCGPGLMGAPMIRHLLRAGHAVRVWNRTPEKAEALVSDGAQVAVAPAELAQQADVVLLCVADGAAVEQVVFGEHGLLAAAAGEGGQAVRVRRIVDHSSIPPELTR